MDLQRHFQKNMLDETEGAMHYGTRTITYATIQWWPTIKYKTELSKLHRLAYIGITGATRTASNAANAVPLGSLLFT